MNKAQAAALLLSGAALGVGGKSALQSASSPAAAALSAPVTHAVDLRRSYSGEDFHFSAYASRAVADAGYIDLGQPKKCRPLSDETKKQLLGCMNAVGATCEW